MPAGNEKPWYSDGLRFECTKCGACCRAPGDVYLTPEDVAKLAVFLDPESDQEEAVMNFLKLHTVNGAGQRLIRTETGCRFLKDDKCGVYPARPVQCRTFPFWRSIMGSGVDWAVAARYCPGMNAGRLWLAHEMEAEMAKSGRRVFFFNGG